MQLVIRKNKLRESLEDDTKCRKRFGAEMARKIKLRMDALAAAESLADFWPPNSPPERCHELKGDMAGTFSMDVKQPYRLLFKDAETAGGMASKQDKQVKDEKERWLAIRSVEILSIEDTHG